MAQAYELTEELRDFLQDNGVLREFIKNLDNPYNSLDGVLIESIVYPFNWKNSIEGYDFWMKLNAQFKFEKKQEKPAIKGSETRIKLFNRIEALILERLIKHQIDDLLDLISFDKIKDHYQEEIGKSITVESSCKFLDNKGYIVAQNFALLLEEYSDDILDEIKSQLQ